MSVQIDDRAPVLCDIPSGVRYVEVQVTPDGITSIVPSVEQWLQAEMTSETEKRMKTSSNAGGKLSHHAEPMDR